MSQKSLIELLKVPEALLYFRGNIIIICSLFFLVLNFGNNLRAFNITVSIGFSKLVSERKRIEKYPDLFTMENIEVLASTISYAVLVVFIGLCLAWIIDNFGLRSAFTVREARRMRRAARLEVKCKETERQVQAPLIYERRFNEELWQIILKLEDIILRYQKAVMAYDAKGSKKVKPSGKEPRLKDLFDDISTVTNTRDRPRPKAKTKTKTKSNTKTKAHSFKPKF